jgi:hypothetical protein
MTDWYVERTPFPAMSALTSTNLHSVGHDGAALYVRFRSAGGAPGRLYRYPTAGREHHEGLIGADSPGRYLADRIVHFHKGERVYE